LNENIPDSQPVGPDRNNFAGQLARAQQIADAIIAPNANSLDQQNSPPVQAVHALAEAGLLGLTTPERFGGLGAPGDVVRAYTEILASACGTTTFVQGQHLSACNLIVGGQNEQLREEVLPIFASGSRLIGIAFAHLRRPGPPAVRCTPHEDGFLFDGVAPWFTGWGVFQDVLLAGTLEDGRFVYAVVPVVGNSGITASEPMSLCAMNASATVALTCERVYVSPQRVMKIITPEQMAAMDLGALLGALPQIFGVTRSSTALVRGIGEKRSDAVMLDTANALDSELAAARAAADGWRERTAEPEYKQGALNVRARCIEMGVRAAHAAVTATGGGANDRSNQAQRLFREAMFYTLTAQTGDIRAATLQHLAARSKEAAQGFE
jgi:alkylation response protein AidB-like acyl-CoA dehydrogenase